MSSADLITKIYKKMTTVIIILAITLIVEIMFSPRIGYTREDRILLWYGKTKRNYIVLW